MKKFFRKFVIFAVVLPSVFFGCSNLFDSNDAGKKDGTGSFSLTIEGVERLILPSAPPELLAYTLVFTPVAPQDAETVTENRTSLNLSDAVYLASGTWDLTVTAYKDAARQQPSARGTLNGIVIETSAVSGSVTLKPIVDAGNGNYRWDITLANGVDSAVMKITPLGTGGTLEQTIDLRGTSSPNLPAASLDLVSGYYNVLFTLTKPGARTVVWKEILHVYQNQESAFTFNFSDEYFNANIHTITYKYNDGTTSDGTATSVHGTAASRPADPERAGYTFDDWYGDELLTTPYDFDTIVTGGFTLYAKWNEGYSGSDLTTLGSWLYKQPSNDADTPYTVTLDNSFELGIMKDATSNWRALLGAIKTGGKYVKLDLSACDMDGTEFNPDYNVATGKDKIVEIALPDIAVSIATSGYTNPMWVPASTFKNFTALKSFSGAGLITVNEYVFMNCASLTQTTLPPNITSIGVCAFSDCTNLALTTLPGGIISIGASAFSGCTSLDLKELPSQALSSIGNYAFQNCMKLTITELPQGITSIGNYAFKNCIGITALTIPTTAVLGEYNPFVGCTGLVSFTVPDSPGGLTAIEGGKALVMNSTILVSYPSASGILALPAGITSIGDDAFRDCSTLVSVTLPTELTAINSWAFYDCRALALLTCAAPTPPTVGLKGFSNVPAATLQIKVPAASVAAYKAAPGWSEYADKIVAIDTPPLTSVDDVGTYLAAQTSAGASADNPVDLPVDIDFGNLRTPKTYGGDEWLSLLDAINTAGKFVNLDISACTIENGAFNHDNEIMVPGMDKIVNINLPSVTSIGNYAFKDCTALKQAALPAGLKTIGIFTFSGCTNLALTSLPAEITEIGEYAFERCENITITELPSGLMSIFGGVFTGCTKITNITLPQGLTAIGSSAFDGCTSLAGINLDETDLTTIDSFAFMGCTGLTEISLPASLDDTSAGIGNSAFENCTGLDLITCNAMTPPTLSPDAFYNTASGLQIKVPAGSVAVYTAHQDWDTFTIVSQ